ncbi:MAG: GNAT family N-acetyltransferase [Gammaproteobacteria bacterium]|nr:GNAT family N-acetyltransferase [Gammaproteobacteria bacterium]
MNTKQIEDASHLFSEHYGTYSETSKICPGGKIKLGFNFYKKLCAEKNCFVSMAYINDTLIGQAFYMLMDTPGGIISWVLQLVVHTEHRRKRIADRLLYSVWGFSNYRAWGLATANPLTIKTLEAATFRKVKPAEILKHPDVIQSIAQSIGYVGLEKIKINESLSVVDSNFCSDHKGLENLKRAYNAEWFLGDCPECHEWFAVIFREQDFENIKPERLEALITHSEDTLNEAYSRMGIASHSWAKHTDSEVQYLLKQIALNKNAFIADFGCGAGRHLKAFKQHGFENKRYRKDEIIQLLEKAGLEVLDSRYVQAGKWDNALQATDKRAKEILLFASPLTTNHYPPKYEYRTIN